MFSKETITRPQGTNSGYVFDNAAPQAPTRFEALSKLYDPATTRHLEDRGIREGWNCLEVGGGGGSITEWLAQRVGPTGRVLVTDIDPRHLLRSKFPNVEVQRHDIVTDDLPESTYDLIHARLVLVHLPARDQVLARLARALKPGGWLVGEELDSASLLPEPSFYANEVFLDTHRAVLKLLEERGLDRGFGRRLHGQFRAVGLVEVEAEGRVMIWEGGSAGASLMEANFQQLRDQLLEGYITLNGLEADLARLQSPRFVTPSAILWTAWGRRAPCSGISIGS